MRMLLIKLSLSPKNLLFDLFVCLFVCFLVSYEDVVNQAEFVSQEFVV